MSADPVRLEYAQPPPRHWRSLAKWTLRIVLLAGLAAGLVWTSRTAWQAWQRYREQRDWLAGTEALTKTRLPPDTVVIDPASGPVTRMEPYIYPGGHGTFPSSLTIPTDPTRATQLRLIGRFASLSAFPFASSMQTGHGRTFVSAGIDTFDTTRGSSDMFVMISDEAMQPGVFPLYRYRSFAYATNLRITSPAGRTLPTVLAGQLDPSGLTWTLPLRIDGKPEWVRFDHSGPTWPTVTTSFGRLTKAGSSWTLTY